MDGNHSRANAFNAHVNFFNNIYIYKNTKFPSNALSFNKKNIYNEKTLKTILVNYALKGISSILLY
jgi:hypothetical protein